MSKNRPSRDIVRDSYHGRVGLGGYSGEIFHRRDRKKGGVLVNLRGGLSDAQTVSLVPLAHSIIKASDGEFIVATSASDRPLDFFSAVLGAINAGAERSMDYAESSKHLVEAIEPDAFLGGGQSEGGITVVRAMKHWRRKSKRKDLMPNSGAFTMDSPIKKMPEGMGLCDVIEGFWGLIKNCGVEAKELSASQIYGLAIESFKHPPSPWEIMYVVGEIMHILKVNTERDVNILRSEGIPVFHAFHFEDVVSSEGADMTYTRSYDGTHLTVLRKPEPLAEYAVEIGGILLDTRPQLIAA